MGDVSCAHCELPVDVGEGARTSNGLKYHSRCHKCYVCSRTELWGVDSFMGVLFCVSCSKRIFGGCPSSNGLAALCTFRAAETGRVKEIEDKGTEKILIKNQPSAIILHLSKDVSAETLIPSSPSKPLQRTSTVTRLSNAKDSEHTKRKYQSDSNEMGKEKLSRKGLYRRTSSKGLYRRISNRNFNQNESKKSFYKKVSSKNLYQKISSKNLYHGVSYRNMYEKGSRKSFYKKVSSMNLYQRVSSRNSSEEGSKKSLRHKSSKTRLFEEKCEKSQMHSTGTVTTLSMAERQLRTSSVTQFPILIESERQLRETSSFSRCRLKHSKAKAKDWLDLDECSERDSTHCAEGKLCAMLSSPYYCFKRKILTKSTVVNDIIGNDPSMLDRQAKKLRPRCPRSVFTEKRSNAVRALYPTIKKTSPKYKLGWKGSGQSSPCADACADQNCRCSHAARSPSYRRLRGKVLRLAGPTRSELLQMRLKIKEYVIPNAFRGH